MPEVEYLVVGAGVTGLSFANWIRQEHANAGLEEPSLAVVEAADEPGGYCRTVVQDGFVWDYSGHFFHFRHPEIEAWLRSRMGSADVRSVVKRARIRCGESEVDFPFQKNFHQLPQPEFLDCLADLYFREQERGGAAPGNFEEMLLRRYGRGIAERFLVPYNRKLYQCDLADLSVEAMGRFFPHADFAEILRHMRSPADTSYNATFTYPAGGAIEYVRALQRDLPEDLVRLSTPLEAVDLESRSAQCGGKQYRYRILVSSVPLPRLLQLSGLEHDRSAFRWNRVLVFNLGFDRKGRDDVHWLYFPDPEYRFYRVGFYDNILGGDRMSLYVEVGLPMEGDVDVDRERDRALADLAMAGIVDGHTLLSSHSVVLDPAYVHMTPARSREAPKVLDALRQHGVYSCGRYGAWTYCSIEDNIVEARGLAAELVHARSTALN